ncbi:MAG: PEGA domain-containing protein [Nanoarchaeota archaeon]|nr:PEGA domain-containing protein [Nanoarchaeota archaeon]
MNIKYYFLFLIILLFIIGCEPVSEKPIGEEEEKGSGILVVNSVPADCDLFLDNENKGKTPLTLYGLEVGTHSILIKKYAYGDYESTVNIEAGKKTEINAYLNEVKEEVIEEKQSEGEKTEVVEEAVFGESEGTVNIDSIIKYYDFSEKQFTDKLKANVDVFSRKYPTHLVFTRYSNVNIKVVDKNINEVLKEDCANIIGSLGFLYSGQTLCVNTKEGLTAAIGGTWEETSESTLTWKILD